jgi:hypothetical protein
MIDLRWSIALPRASEYMNASEVLLYFGIEQVSCFTPHSLTGTLPETVKFA